MSKDYENLQIICGNGLKWIRIGYPKTKVSIYYFPHYTVAKDS